MKTKLLVKKIPEMNKKIFDADYKEIRNLIKQTKNKHGVYALYDKKEELYYVGQTKRDIINRVKQHLTDKHRGKWERFSIYFTKNPQQACEMEAVILSMVPKPKGNTQKKSRIGEDKGLMKLMEQLDKEINNRKSLFPKKDRTRQQAKQSNRKTTQKKSKAGNKRALDLVVNLFETDKPLKAKYKGQEYRAMLLKSGKVLYKGKEYNSLSGATKAIGSGASGFVFWQIQDHKNRWVTLSTLREKSRAFKKVA